MKCDGKLPACTACEKSGKVHECTGGGDQFARGKERSYMASLESRVEKLEKKLAAMDSRRGSVSMLESQYEPQTAIGQTEVRSETPAVTLNKPGKRDDENEIEELVADLGYMAINATTRDFYGFTKSMTFAKLMLKASAASKVIESKPKAGLPERHVATQLIQHYFDKIFTTLPCLNESSFFGAVNSVYRDEAACNPFDVYTVYMVLAIGTMSLSKRRDSVAAHNAACFVKSALEHADSVISPSGVTGVQATLLLVQYSMLEPAHFNSWYLIGTASRIMIDIGLHQEPLKNLRKKSDVDLRRRIFYCVYTLDRSISMVLQRPVTFSDDSVLVELPRAANPDVAKRIYVRGTLTPMIAATKLFELRKLQSEWYQNLHLSGNVPIEDPKPYFRQRTEMLKVWKDTMPESINQSTKDWLYLEWYYLNVYVAAPCPKIPRPCDEAMVQVFNNCVNYARRFRDILQDSNARFVYTYHDALRTYFIGNNFLHAVWHSEHALIDDSNIESALETVKAITFVLTSMIVRWQEVETLRDRFQEESTYMISRRFQQKLENLVTPLESVISAPQFPYEWSLPVTDSSQPEYNPSAHIATADFGNVAFYRYG